VVIFGWGLRVVGGGCEAASSRGAGVGGNLVRKTKSHDNAPSCSSESDQESIAAGASVTRYQLAQGLLA
jgi:hypothetical protein